jgi:hypothetical protein
MISCKQLTAVHHYSKSPILSDLSPYCKNVLTLLAFRQLTALNKIGTLSDICFQFMTETKENENIARES